MIEDIRDPRCVLFPYCGQDLDVAIVDFLNNNLESRQLGFTGIRVEALGLKQSGRLTFHVSLEGLDSKLKWNLNLLPVIY